jgi:hypothetical protein
MFTVVNSVDDLPVGVDDGALFFCSKENNIFVNKNNEWVSYETFVGGFEEIASVILENDITVEDGLFFDDAPFFDTYKGSYYYPISFSAKALTSLDGGVFDLSIVSSEGYELLSINASKIVYPNFVFYYCLDERSSENDLIDDQRKALNLPVRVYDNAFNVKGSNVYVEGPLTLKLFKPIGV